MTKKIDRRAKNGAVKTCPDNEIDEVIFALESVIKRNLDLIQKELEQPLHPSPNNKHHPYWKNDM